MPFEADSASDRRLLILRFRRVCLGTFLFLNAFTAPALGQGPVHRKEAIILEGRAKDKNYPDDPSYDQVDMEANAAQMKAALEAHGYTVQVTNSWTGDKDSFTGIISALSTGANALVASDEVVIYITGHGKQSEGGAGNFVDKADLTDRDGHAVDPNAAVNRTYYGVMEIGGTGSNRAGNPTVTSTMLKREIQKLPDKHTGVVIDTCYAGMNIVPLKQIPGVQSIYTASAAWECAYFGAVGTTIPITWSDGKTQFPLVDRNGAEGSAYSYPFIQGLSSAPANASIGDLLQAGGNFALTHDPTAIAGTKDTETQHPLPAYATDTQKKQYKYKTHPQSYSRPDPRIALTNAQNAYNTAQTNFQAAQDKALGTAKAVNDAAIARDAAKAANPQGGQAVNDAQTALEKAIANDAAAAGAERAAKETLDAKKGDVDKAQAILNEVSYNSPSAETDKSLAMAAPSPSTQVSFDGSGPENSALATSATSAPPDLPDYEQPPVPAPNNVWMPGYWGYVPAGYFWVPGTWVVPPAPGLLWTPGYWGFSSGLYRWNEGYWGPHVGFYGGVNYGFGYGGVGYVGGVWEHGVFQYNTAVTHVDTTQIHSTYSDRTSTTTATETTTNRTCFNGGSGTTSQPTAAEKAAASDPHTAPTTEQRRHEYVASNNRSLLASENGGHPSVAATMKPGEFSGTGVVAARGSSGRVGKTETTTSTPSTGATTPSSSDNAKTAKANKKTKPSKQAKTKTESEPVKPGHPK